MGLFGGKKDDEAPKPPSYERVSKMPTDDMLLLMETAAMHIGTCVDGIRGAKLEDKPYYFGQLEIYMETLQSCQRVAEERLDTEYLDAYK